MSFLKFVVCSHLIYLASSRKVLEQTKPNLNDLVQRAKSVSDKNTVLIKFDDNSNRCNRVLEKAALSQPEGTAAYKRTDSANKLDQIRNDVFFPQVETILKSKLHSVVASAKLIEAPLAVNVSRSYGSLEDVTEYQLVSGSSNDGIHTPEAEKTGSSLKHTLTFRWLKNVNQEAVELDSIISPEKFAEELKSNPCVKYAAPSPRAATLQFLDDPLNPSQWWIQESSDFGAGLEAAHQMWEGGDENFTVGVLDTGCDLEHPDMYKLGEYDQFAFNAAEAGGDSWDDYSSSKCKNNRDDDRNGIVDDCFGVNWSTLSGDAWDFVGHGTHVASVLAGATSNKRYTAAVCPKCKVLCLMPLGHVTRSINYAISRNVTVMNWSGSYFRDGLTEDFKRIIHDSLKTYEERVDGLWVCAAGNHPVNLDLCLSDEASTTQNPTSHSNASPLKKGDEERSATPAICKGYDDSVIRRDYHFGFPCELSTTLQNVLCVGASDQDGNNAYFSTYGKKTVNVFAPGKDILAHFPVYLGNIVRILSGTSMASPVVAGIAGLIRSRYPSLTAFETRTVIEQSCRKRQSLQDLTKCGGIVDAGEALKIAQQLVTTSKTTTLAPTPTTSESVSHTDA